ncbi:MAG: leucine-rich repeat domain-containing protein [Muribaculaceae bacterium]|nr:leucine-rich repeat domain-containing protein [Muribaculaceae bacterium]
MKRLIISLMIAFTVIAANAQVEFYHKGLKFTTINEKEVKVGKIDDKHKPSGKLVIPAQVEHDGVTYNVTEIASWGFFGCDKVTDLILPPTLQKIDIWAFCKCEKIKEIIIPASVREIGYAAFENCETITTITLPDGLTEVPDRLLQECINLKIVKLPASITSIGSSAFSSCKSLESISLPENVTQINGYAFAYCDNLKNITMPKQLTTIGSDVFSCCKTLTEIEIPEGVTSIGSNIFNCCTSLEKVTLPSTLTSISGNPFSSCKSLKEYHVADGNDSFAVIDGILFSKNMTELIACPTQKELGDYIVPESVTTIAAHAFYDCRYLTSIKMTEVKSIGESAFYGCNNLVSVDFGNKLEYLGKGAFYSNHKIENIVLPDSFKHMDMINFDFCSGLRTVSVSEELSTRIDDFNNLSFNFNSKDLRFIVRCADGTTKALTIDEIPDAKALIPER